MRSIKNFIELDEAGNKVSWPDDKAIFVKRLVNPKYIISVRPCESKSGVMSEMQLDCLDIDFEGKIDQTAILRLKNSYDEIISLLESIKD
jgi:hypothetical protein